MSYTRMHYADFCRCGKKASRSGLCLSCYQRHYRSTSDGRKTGSAPKLTPEQQTDIRRLDRQFVSRHTIASRFGVNLKTITAVLNRTGAYRDKP